MEKRQMFAIRKYDAIVGYTDDELLAKAIATRICDSEANYHAAYVCKEPLFIFSTVQDYERWVIWINKMNAWNKLTPEERTLLGLKEEPEFK